MNLRIPVALACAALLALPLSSRAALFRAYLASTGNDANPCTLQQPCRLLPRALEAVDERGEIWMLDSANYNTGVLGTEGALRSAGNNRVEGNATNDNLLPDLTSFY